MMSDDRQLRAELTRISLLPNAMQFGPAGVDLIFRLRSAGSAGLEFLRAVIEEPSAPERLLAVRLLAYLYDRRAVDLLLAIALNDAEMSAAVLASQSLALMPGALAVEALDLLTRKGRNLESTLNGVWGLCNQGSDTGVQLARKYLSSADNPLNYRVAFAANISAIQHPALMGLMSDVAEWFATVPDVVSHVIMYFRAIGTPEAHARLERLAGDRRLDPEQRTSAGPRPRSN